MPLRRRPEPPLDPFERAARRSDPEYARLAEAADAAPPAGLRAPRLLMLFALLVVVAVVVRGGGRGTTRITTSCTQPGFRLSSATVDYDARLGWAATGPADLRAVLALDSARPPGQDAAAGPVPLKGCVAHGAFGVQAAPGKHTVTLFLLRSDGTVSSTLTRSLSVR